MTQLDDQDKPLVGIRWIIAFTCMLVNFSAFFVRNSFPVALLSLIDARIEGNTIPAVFGTSFLQAKGEKNSNAWTSTQQSLALSSYFWGFAVSRFFVSRVVEIVGQRKLIAFSLAFNAILETLAPVSASIHPLVLTAVRTLIGFGYGAFPAALGSLMSTWAPREELASMYTTSFSGTSLGAITAYLISGKLSEVYGWSITFWIGSILNFISLPIWMLVVRNQPEDHPWLSHYEKKLLDANKNIKPKKVVPWRDILKSPYIYICMFSMFGATMLDSVFSTVGPSYLTSVGRLDITKTSYICGATYFSAMVFTLINGRISDFLINRKIMAKINTRKLFHCIGTFVAPVMLIVMSFCEFNVTLLLFVFVLTGTLSKGIMCSYPISVIDFAPNYVGTVQGLLTFGFLGSALTPPICAALLQQENGWDKTFYVASGINFVSCLIYCSFMTADAQKWNFQT